MNQCWITSLARYYSSAQGRFTSADAPFADQYEGDPQSWNLFAYVRNNPLKYSDPFGFWKQVGAGVWEWEKDDTWQGLADILHVKKKALKKAFNGAELGSGLVVDTNNLSAGAAWNIYASTEITPLFRGVANEMNRREAASLHLIEIVGGFNLAPAVLASATLSGGGVIGLELTNPFVGLPGGVLNSLIGAGQRELLRGFFGQGIQGALSRLANFELTEGLTVRTLEIAREIATNAIRAGKDSVGTQAVRLIFKFKPPEEGSGFTSLTFDQR